MRILVLASTFPRWRTDSTPPFVFDLSRGLAARGYEMHVVAPHAAGTAVLELMDGVTVHRFRYAPSGFESLNYDGGILENLRADRRRWALVAPFLAAELNAMVRVARRVRADAIHAHWLIPQGLVAAMGRSLLRRPIVMTAHGADVFAMTHGTRRRLLARAARSADICTVNSTAVGNALAEATGVQAKLIPMGVDMAAFPATRHPADNSESDRTKPLILFVGRLAEKKGVRHLVEAMPAVRESVPDAVLRIVGDGPERASLERLTADLGLEGAVEFTGAVPHADLQAHYQSAEVFVAPSIVAASGDTEGLGVVVLEAAASGTSVVASRIGGITDVIEHEQTGLLVEPGNPEAIAAAVVRLLRDDGLRASVAKAARRRVVERYSWDSVADQFDALFRSLERGSLTR